MNVHIDGNLSLTKLSFFNTFINDNRLRIFLKIRKIRNDENS